MSEYEDYLIREVTGQSPDFMEQEPEETNGDNETGDQQGETKLSAMKRTTRDNLTTIHYRDHKIGVYQYRDWDGHWVQDCSIDGEFSQCEGIASRGNLTIEQAKQLIDEITK